MSKAKELLNIQFEKFTGKHNTTDLIKISELMKKEQKLVNELSQEIKNNAAAADINIKINIDDFIKKGGK